MSLGLIARTAIMLPPHPTPSYPAAVQRLGQWGYMSLGLIAALPCMLLPLALQPASEAAKPLTQRYWFKVHALLATF